MKITCTQENLARALSFLERATGKQSTLPILSNFLLRGGKGQIKLSATNLEIGVVFSIGAKVDGEGELAVPVKVVNNFIHNLPSGDVVSIKMDGNALSMMSNGYSMRVHGLDPKDFPIIPEKKGNYFLSIPAAELKSALIRLFPCVSINESRLELTGINFLFSEQSIAIAATDSFRLGEQIIYLSKENLSQEYKSFIENTQSLILPQGTLQEVARIISPETKDVKVIFEENQAFFEIDGVLVVSRIINGKYPDYKQILPKDFSYYMVLDRDEMLRAVRMASVFSSQMSGEMTISIFPHKGECVISSRSSEIGENKTVLKGEISGGEAMEMVFNPRYVLDGLNVSDAKKIAFFANTPSTPSAFRIIDDGTGKIIDTFLYIVMPVRK